MIAIVDYGLGNLGSIKNMLKKIGVESQITGDISAIDSATKLILPGVGAFDNGMENLNATGLHECLNRKVLQQKTPILGICLGMQLMTKSSEEGKLQGLGWIDAQTIKFRFDDPAQLKTVPHMGWEYVNAVKKSNLIKDMHADPRYYFVHSYYVNCMERSDELLLANYGNDFVAGFERDNIVGVQFHPEKSHKYGMRLLKNFIENY